MTNHPKFTASHDSAARKSSSRTATGSRKAGNKFFACCYAAGGLSVDYKIEVSKAVLREGERMYGKRKRYCRKCVEILLKSVREDVIEHFNKAGLR